MARMTPESAREVALLPHPERSPGCVGAVRARVVARRGQLHLRYLLQGDVARLALADPLPGERRDGLWRHTCCEAFVRTGDGPGYTEWNLAPSGAWAAYGFHGYREGMALAAVSEAPRISVTRGVDHLTLDATVPRHSDAPVRLALATVVEEPDGTLVYWALRHAPGRPDFHHPENFALELA